MPTNYTSHQLRPANTNPASLYSPAADTEALISSLKIANTSGAATSFRIFLDDDGTTYTEPTALAWDIPILADQTIEFVDKDRLLMGANEGNLAVRTADANALTFTASVMEVTP